ncbi:MAG: hypothetical protein ACJ79E_13135 [Anaeromyxobacteraceae bacterium]
MPTLALCLEEARAGSPVPVYLLDGDAFLTGRGARELAEALVPAGERDLMLVELDGAASPAEVAAEIATRGLFAGPASRQVVPVSEPASLPATEAGGGPCRGARDAGE